MHILIGEDAQELKDLLVTESQPHVAINRIPFAPRQLNPSRPHGLTRALPFIQAQSAVVDYPPAIAPTTR